MRFTRGSENGNEQKHLEGEARPFFTTKLWRKLKRSQEAFTVKRTTSDATNIWRFPNEKLYTRCFLYP